MINKPAYEELEKNSGIENTGTGQPFQALSFICSGIIQNYLIFGSVHLRVKQSVPEGVKISKGDNKREGLH